ncbi:Hypothetical_protein [Hexamita inflata]|uniref:Hypothetical_protein n=1 Tax=Hexamita inflata TaxID=28002 RepID=A0AA86P258_9EUKA|nr:Hypothetical protein HINF_LOCUS17435 [Hexamita inflata]
MPNQITYFLPLLPLLIVFGLRKQSKFALKLQNALKFPVKQTSFKHQIIQTEEQESVFGSKEQFEPLKEEESLDSKLLQMVNCKDIQQFKEQFEAVKREIQLLTNVEVNNMKEIQMAIKALKPNNELIEHMNAEILYLQQEKDILNAQLEHESSTDRSAAKPVFDIQLRNRSEMELSLERLTHRTGEQENSIKELLIDKMKMQDTIDKLTQQNKSLNKYNKTILNQLDETFVQQSQLSHTEVAESQNSKPSSYLNDSLNKQLVQLQVEKNMVASRLQDSETQKNILLAQLESKIEQNNIEKQHQINVIREFQSQLNELQTQNQKLEAKYNKQASKHEQIVKKLHEKLRAQNTNQIDVQPIDKANQNAISPVYQSDSQSQKLFFSQKVIHTNNEDISDDNIPANKLFQTISTKSSRTEETK